MRTDIGKHSETLININTRMKALFVAQDDKPTTLKEINLARLTPFQRGLLVTDGTVTRFIEAYTFMSVAVVLLQQTKQTLTTEHTWLELSAGEEVISRRVALQSQLQDEPLPIIHTYADSFNCVETSTEITFGRFRV